MVIFFYFAMMNIYLQVNKLNELLNDLNGHIFLLIKYAFYKTESLSKLFIAQEKLNK